MAYIIPPPSVRYHDGSLKPKELYDQELADFKIRLERHISQYQSELAFWEPVAIGFVVMTIVGVIAYFIG